MLTRSTIQFHLFFVIFTFFSPVQAETLQGSQLIVTATRFPVSIETAPVNITTITADEIARSNATNISDILRYQAGIDVTDLYGISGSKASVDMAGFGQNGGQNTLVLLNGRRLNDVDLQGANLATIPLGSIAQIEIIHGSATVLYGDNAVSGVINIVTKNGFDDERAAIKLQSGSFQTNRISGNFQTHNDDSALSLSVDGLKSDGYREQSRFENTNFIGEASRENDSGLYGIRLISSREDLELPGALGEGTFKSDPTASTFTTEKAREQRHGIEGYFDGDELAAELALQKKHQEATVYGDTAADLSTLSFTPRTRQQSGRHNIVAGLDIYHSRLDAEGEFDNFSPPPATSINNSETTRESIALYLSDSIKLAENTEINVGARYQKINLKVNNTGNITGNSSDKQTDSVNAADITLSHRYQNGSRNYLRMAHSFRSPVLDEMWSYFSGTISLLKTQTANHLEIGTQQEIADNISFNANLFYILMQDEIAYDFLTGNNVNLDNTRHDGLNIQLRSSVTEKLSLQTGYAYRRAEFREGVNSGNTIPLVPEHKFTLSGQYQFNNEQQLGVDAVYTGERYFGDDNANIGKQMPAYTRVDASYTHQWKNWQARFQVQNLTNVSSADSGFYNSFAANPYFYYPLPERAFYLSLEAELW